MRRQQQTMLSNTSNVSLLKPVLQSPSHVPRASEVDSEDARQIGGATEVEGSSKSFAAGSLNKPSKVSPPHSASLIMTATEINQSSLLINSQETQISTRDR